MINHARTLLMNIDGSRAASTGWYDYYIPAYRARQLGTQLTELRAALFGSAPDMDGLRYRVAQYLALLHTPDYEPFIAALDLRLTYDPTATVLPIDLIAVTAAADVAVNATSLFISPPFSGKTRFTWTLNYGTTPGLPGLVQLDTGVQATWNFGREMPRGTTRDIIVRRPPEPNLADVLARAAQVPAPDLWVGDGVEPIKTFHNLFLQHPLAQAKLAGLMLALIYQTEAAGG